MNFKRIPQLISKNAEKYPNKTYIFFKDRRYTYFQTELEVLRTATVLAASGVKKGNRVALLIGNSPEYIFAYFGIIAIGAIAVPINTFLTHREIAVNMNDCTASFLITSSDFADTVPPLIRNVSTLKQIFTYEECSIKAINIRVADVGQKPPQIETDGGDVVSLTYTSGTTGKPKGVMLTHKNLLADILAFKMALKTRHKDRFLALLPLFHSYAFMTCVLGPLESGCSLIIWESIKDITKKSYKRTLLFLRPSVLLGIPQLYSAMAKIKPSWIEKLLYPFRLQVSGGAPLPEDTMNSFYKIYGVPVIEGYGLSEASPVVAFNPLDRQKSGTVGKALYGIEVKVVDADGNTLPPNEPGELCVRGANVMKGYWHKPEETDAAIRDGWLHTGDIAKIDEEGYITIIDRIKDLIITKGINVYPREIEELLYQHKGVVLAAVIGLPDKDGSEIIMAVVSAEKGADISESGLKNYLKQNLAAYKVPKHVMITENIPVNASGKILKRELKEFVIKAGKKSENVTVWNTKSFQS